MLLQQIRERRNKRFIAVQAYTCPDIATAVLEAGFKLALFDVDYSTLRPRPETISVSPEDTAAVVLSNLYGMPDDLQAWTNFANAGVILIDDACQAALSTVNGVSVGQRTGWGVYSFGRGKAISAIGGGAVYRKEDVATKSEARVDDTDLLQEAKSLLYWIGFWAFSHPALYGIAERLPFLKLGTTEFVASIQRRPITRIELSAMRAKLPESAEEQRSMIRNSLQWLRSLTGSAIIHPFCDRISESGGVVPIRYPIILESAEKREQVLKKFRTSALSCTSSYPKTLADYSELRGSVEHGPLDGSRRVAETIITLPTHKAVTSAMISRLTAPI